MLQWSHCARSWGFGELAPPSFSLVSQPCFHVPKRRDGHWQGESLQGGLKKRPLLLER